MCARSDPSSNAYSAHRSAVRRCRSRRAPVPRPHRAECKSVRSPGHERHPARSSRAEAPYKLHPTNAGVVRRGNRTGTAPAVPPDLPNTYNSRARHPSSDSASRSGPDGKLSEDPRRAAWEYLSGRSSRAALRRPGVKVFPGNTYPARAPTNGAIPGRAPLRELRRQGHQPIGSKHRGCRNAGAVLWGGATIQRCSSRSDASPASACTSAPLRTSNRAQARAA